MKRPGLDIGGLILLALSGVLWVSRSQLAGLLAGAWPAIGVPAASLLARALVGLVVAAGVVRLRAFVQYVMALVLIWVDAIEERLEKLPPAQAKAGRALVIALFTASLTIGVFELTAFGGALETRAYDAFFRLRFPERSQVELATAGELPSAQQQSDTMVLALDDETITHLGWPLPRVQYARLIDAVREANPASLNFDVSFVDPSREHPEWDVGIGEAAKRAGNVTFNFAVARSNNEGITPATPAALKALDANSIPWHEAASALPDYSEIVGGDVLPMPVIAPVAENAQAIAMSNVILDGGDDVLRHSLLVARLGKRLLPALSLRLAARALNVPLDAIRIVPGSHIDLGGKRQIPIDRLGRSLVRYQGRHDTSGHGPFQYVSLWSLLRADSTVSLAGNPLGDDQKFVLDEQTRVSLDGAPVLLAEVDSALLKVGTSISGKARYSTDPGRLTELNVMTNAAAPTEPDFELLDEANLRFNTTIGSLKNRRHDVSMFAGKHVFVGSTALAAADLRVSPLGELPGVEHHATMFSNILRDDFFHPTSAATNALLIFLAALLAAGIGVSLSGEAGLLVTALLMLASLTGSFLSFSAGRSAPIVSLAAAYALTALVCLVLGARASRKAHARAAQEREFVRATFGRYLTEQVVEELLGSPDGLKLGGKRQFVTIMMTDLRGFTSMCGTMEPENVVKLLNHYLEAMTKIIARYGGTIDEFIGDAILTVFGAPLPIAQAEARAVSCAIEMLNAMPEVNQWNSANGLPEVEMGIGVHSGEVVMGNIGSSLRAKYAMVGATINLTSRVESFTVGGQVLISDTTRVRCGDGLKVGTSQVVSPKGVKGTLTIHEALGFGAPFNVSLNAANATEELVTPSVEISLRYAPVKGKDVAELKYVAKVEQLSALGFELRVDTELAALTDLQLRVIDGDGLRPGDLYGKVLKTVRPNVVYLRLTSVPPELRPFLEGARAAPAVAATAALPTAPQVTT